jgi:phage head maturation protease
MKISPTVLGDESLTLAEDGALHVSVGFIPDPAHDEWNRDRSAVVRHACELWEISLVPFPAYEEAEVLAVRRHPTLGEVAPIVVVVDGTPRKDAILAKLAEIGYSPRL